MGHIFLFLYIACFFFCLFVCLFVLVENWIFFFKTEYFEYYNMVTMKIKFSPFSRVCCFWLLGADILSLFLYVCVCVCVCVYGRERGGERFFPKYFAKTVFLIMYYHWTSCSVISVDKDFHNCLEPKRGGRRKKKKPKTFLLVFADWIWLRLLLQYLTRPPRTLP